MSDTIYRQGAIDAFRKATADGDKVDFCVSVINGMPSAERKGEWIDRSDGGRILYPWDESHECNQCGHNGSGAWEYCPRCGADMRPDNAPLADDDSIYG